MASASELNYHFNAKKDAKKLFSVCENPVFKTKTEIEKAHNVKTYLDGEVLKYYFDNFTEDNAPNEEARSLQELK